MKLPGFTILGFYLEHGFSWCKHCVHSPLWDRMYQMSAPPTIRATDASAKPTPFENQTLKGTGSVGRVSRQRSAKYGLRTDTTLSAVTGSSRSAG